MRSFPIVNHRGHDAVHVVTHGEWDKKRCLADRPGWDRAFRQKVKFWSEPYQEFRNKCEVEDRAGVRCKPWEAFPSSRLLSVENPFKSRLPFFEVACPLPSRLLFFDIALRSRGLPFFEVACPLPSRLLFFDIALRSRGCHLILRGASGVTASTKFISSRLEEQFLTLWPHDPCLLPTEELSPTELESSQDTE